MSQCFKETVAERSNVYVKAVFGVGLLLAFACSLLTLSPSTFPSFVPSSLRHSLSLLLSAVRRRVSPSLQQQTALHDGGGGNQGELRLRIPVRVQCLCCSNTPPHPQSIHDVIFTLTLPAPHLTFTTFSGRQFQFLSLTISCLRGSHKKERGVGDHRWMEKVCVHVSVLGFCEVETSYCCS